MPRVGIPRAFAACLAAAGAALLFACPQMPAPSPGAPDAQSAGWVSVPFGRVNLAGGNLLVERRALDFDTRLGTVALGAVWNSADAVWRFSFEMSYDGATFVDASGARYDTSAVANGRAIPGSCWVRLDARTLRTKGGLVHEFDAAGRLSSVHWASGAMPRLEYRSAAVAGAQRVVELRQWAAPGDATRLASFGYDGAGRLITIDDRAGRRASFGWNAAGRLVAARDALDVARGSAGFRYEYAPDGALTAITSADGVRAEIQLAGGRALRVRAVGAGDPETAFGYATLAGGSFRTTVTDALGNASSALWDAQRRLLELRNAAGERAAWTWADARPASFTGPDGVTTRWTWSDDDPIEEAQASGNVVRVVYEPGGEDRSAPGARPVRRVSDALGPVAERSYDAQGRLVRVANGAGEATALAWSADNLLASARAPSGVETRFRDYGDHGHPRRVERAGRSQTLAYDTVGNLLAGVGSATLSGAGDSGVVERAYDEDRNLVRLSLASADFAATSDTQPLTIERRSDGQPLRIRRPKGGDSEFTYDALGRPVERRDRALGVWQATRTERDRLGRPTAVVRPNGMRTQAQYDAAGRRSALAQLRGGAFESGVGFAYAAGRVVSLADTAYGAAPESTSYDAAGRVSAIDYPGGERLELAYDLRSRIVEERYVARSGAELRRLRFAYDLADREIEVRDGAAALRSLRFADGRLAEERFGNGLVRSYAYGADDGVLSDATLRDAAGTLLERSRLEQTAGLGLAIWHATTTSAGDVAWTSHELHQLAPIGDGQPGPRATGFSADAEGNAWTRFGYDVLGNLADVDFGPDAGGRMLQYDDEGARLLRVRRASGAIEHAYAYDEAGFVVQRDGEAVAHDGAGRPLAVGSRMRFAWDTLGRLVSLTRDGVGERTLFGGRVRASAAGVPLAIELGAVRLDLLGAHRYRHLDFRGNVKLVSDARGHLLSHVRYGPYGADAVRGAADPDAGFAGGRALGEHLALLGVRLYEPACARFLEPDPVFQLVNQYAYALGNPIWFADADGASATAATAVALGVGVVGLHAGVAIVALAAIGTGIAPVAVLAAGVSIAAFSLAFSVGAVAQPSPAVVAAVMVGGGVAGPLARAFIGASPLAAVFGGFVAGSQFGKEFILTEPAPPPPPPPPAPPGDPGTGHQIKDVSIAVATPPRVGCSPAALGDLPRGRARRVLAILLGLQALVLAGMLRRRGSRGEASR